MTINESLIRVIDFGFAPSRRQGEWGRASSANPPDSLAFQQCRKTIASAGQNRIAVREEDASERPIKETVQRTNHFFASHAILHRKKRKPVRSEIDDRITHDQCSVVARIMKRDFARRRSVDCDDVKSADIHPIFKFLRGRKLAREFGRNEDEIFTREICRGASMICIRYQDTSDFPQIFASFPGKRDGINNNGFASKADSGRTKLSFH